MRTKLTLPALALSLSCSVMAQTLEFNHCSLKDMKFVSASGSTVNIRKGPSTKAPKLYHGCLPESDDCCYMWSDKLDKDYDSSPCVLNSDDMKAVTGEENGFWKSTHGGSDYNFPVYVAKSVTKVVTPQPLTDEVYKNSICMSRFTGTLSGVVLTVDANEVEGWSNILTGMVEGNALVFSHSTAGRMEYDNQVDGVKFTSDSDGLVIKFGDKYKCTVSNAWAEYETLDLSKLTYAMQVQLLEKLGCKDKPNILSVYTIQGNIGLQPALFTTPDASAMYEYSVKKFQPAHEDGFICSVAETMPQFPGGEKALMQYISTNIKYPKDAQKSGIQGRVLVSFIVEKDGKISSPEVVRSVHKSLDKEALRVVKSMPKWTPGKLNGKLVRTKYTLPITFRLL